MESPYPPLPEQMNKTNNKMAVAAGALGIGGVFLSLIGIVLGVISQELLAAIPVCSGIGILMGIVGLILGIIALVQLKRNPAQKGKGLAITGVVLGGIAVILICLSPVWVVSALLILGPVVGNVFTQINSSLMMP